MLTYEYRITSHSCLRLNDLSSNFDGSNTARRFPFSDVADRLKTLLVSRKSKQEFALNRFLESLETIPVGEKIYWVALESFFVYWTKLVPN